MDKNTVIAIFLSTIVIIGGFTLQNILFPPQPVVHNTQETAVSVETYQNSAAENKQSKEAVLLSLPDTEQNTEENFTVETDLVQVTFTNKGGDILSYKLKKHTDKTDFVEMADFVTDSNRAFSVLLGNENSNSVNEIFNTRIISDTVIGFYKNFQVQNTDGSFSSFTLVKQYSFIPDDYMFELKITIDGDDSFTGLNIAGSAYTLRTSPQIGPTWNQKQDRYEYRKFYYLTEGKKKTVTPKRVKSKKLPIPLPGLRSQVNTLHSFLCRIHNCKVRFFHLFPARQTLHPLRCFLRGDQSPVILKPTRGNFILDPEQKKISSNITLSPIIRTNCTIQNWTRLLKDPVRLARLKCC